MKKEKGEISLVETCAAPRENTRREEQLQFLRFLAFLNVFVCHADSWLFFEYPSSGSGRGAVSFFFMLSGLLTGYGFYGRTISLSLRSYGGYLWKKLKKLYPLYISMAVFMLMYNGVPNLLLTQGLAGSMSELRQFFRTALMIQSWFTEGYFSYNGVGWFLSTLLFLMAWNLPVMFLLNRLQKHPRRHILLLGMMGGVLCADVVFSYLTRGWDLSYWHYIFPPARLGQYLIGILMGILLREWKPRVPQGKYTAVLFTALELGAMYFWYRTLSYYGSPWRVHTLNWILPNMLLLSVFTIGAGWVSRLFRCPVLVRLGDAAFPCFLIHQVLILLYMCLIGENQDTPQAKAVAFLYCLGLTVLLALQLSKPPRKKQ